MVISAIHVPGKWNCIADGKSRLFHDLIEWILDFNLFKQITKHPGPSCRSVCLLDKSSDAGICVMEARTRGNSNRCFQYPLGLSTELPVSSILPDTNVPKESNTGTGRLYSHCSSMKEPVMVSSASVYAYRAPSQCQRILKLPGTDKIHPLCCQKKFQVAAWKTSGKAYKTKVFQKKCQKFFCLLGEATQPAKQYESAWKGWSSWCSKEKVNPFSTTIKHILSYLADLFHQGRQYQMI